jgi:hypothetical protein
LRRIVGGNKQCGKVGVRKRDAMTVTASRASGSRRPRRPGSVVDERGGPAMATQLAVIYPKALHTVHRLRTRTVDGRDTVVQSGYAELGGNDLKGKSNGTWNRRELLFASAQSRISGKRSRLSCRLSEQHHERGRGK